MRSTARGSTSVMVEAWSPAARRSVVDWNEPAWSWPSSRSHSRDHSLNQPSLVDRSRHAVYASIVSASKRSILSPSVSQ